jgi:ribosomal protein S18 acetylase RimI-like enzyme
MVELQPMTQAHLEEWSRRIWPVYREEMIRAGASAEAADRDIIATIEATMPDGVPAPGNHMLAAWQEGAIVGNVWLVHREPDWHIYDIEIEETRRGQGLGRAALRAIEHFVRERGGRSLQLSVFGFNAVARNLYESEGYETIRLSMKKSL